MDSWEIFGSIQGKIFFGTHKKTFWKFWFWKIFFDFENFGFRKNHIFDFLKFHFLKCDIFFQKKSKTFFSENFFSEDFFSIWRTFFLKIKICISIQFLFRNPKIVLRKSCDQKLTTNAGQTKKTVDLVEKSMVLF